MMLTWKYTLPAFLVPFAFTLAPEGLGLLWQAPLATVAGAAGSAALGVAALAFGAAGWLRRRATLVARTLAVAAGLLLIHPHPASDIAGIATLATAAGLHLRRGR
jgi:TRAP-type uncharacterized transport system fused permease subunit